MGKLKKSNDKNFDLKEQDVLIGSRVLNSDTTKNRIEYFINNVEDNLCGYAYNFDIKNRLVMDKGCY